jgi:hypothetical protein
VADAATRAAIPAVIRVATVAVMGAASGAGIGDLSVASSPCSRHGVGVGRAVAIDIGVISTATRQIAGIRAIAAVISRAAGATTAEENAAVVVGANAVVVAAAVMSTRAQRYPARK